MLKKIFLIIITILIILVFILIINSAVSLKRDYLVTQLSDSKFPEKLYVENKIYEDEKYIGLVKYYIYNDIEYIYQENHKNEKIEIYINTKEKKSITVLHSEKKVIQNEYKEKVFLDDIQNNKQKLIEKLNNVEDYQYNYLGKEFFERKKCYKISLIGMNNNEIYYIDSNTGYVVKFVDINNKIIETFNYSNSIKEVDLKEFDMNNYRDFEYIYGK